MSAAIFNGTSVKLLKDIFKSKSGYQIFFSSTDPTAGGGLAASVGSVLYNTSSGEVYKKTSAPDLGWVKLANAFTNIQEKPTGTIDDNNTSFTLSQTPTTNSLALFLDGLMLIPGGGEDYTLSGTTITMVTAPATSQVLYAKYTY